MNYLFQIFSVNDTYTFMEYDLSAVVTKAYNASFQSLQFLFVHTDVYFCRLLDKTPGPLSWRAKCLNTDN